MEKTEKTMAELEIDQNVKFEWDSITEAGAALKPLSGPGCAIGIVLTVPPFDAAEADLSNPRERSVLLVLHIAVPKVHLSPNSHLEQYITLTDPAANHQCAA